jgi:hypothetical protein
MVDSKLPIPPNPTTAPPAGVPESPQGMPFSLPPEMTSEQAQTRLTELKTDDGWRARWIAGDARANTEFDALTRKAVGQQPAAPVRVPDENAEALKALGPPANVKDYKIDVKDPVTGFPMRIPDVDRALITGVLLPGAHAIGLSQSDVSMAADFIVKPMDAERCEQTLRNIWRDDYEAGARDFVAAMAAQPAHVRILLTETYEEQLGNNPALIASIVSAWRRKQGRR